LSLLWPQEDIPFTESGIVPDVIINPHAFPSRMTIGMLLESISSKSGAIHGYYPNGTPFQYDEENKAIDHFGKELKEAGYNYYGNEIMYSGTLGVEFKAEIYIGVVFYQRLRHMVKDKFQVRATGRVSNLTHQPIKGRKKGGGK
jgi:DNA-directed RNA polymerase I subunit RPA2